MEVGLLVYLFGGLVFRTTLMQVHRQMRKTFTPTRYFISVVIAECYLIGAWPVTLYRLGRARA